MTDDLQFRRLRFMRSRIPAQDALEVFVPDGAPADREIEELQSTPMTLCWVTEAGPFAGSRA